MTVHATSRFRKLRNESGQSLVEFALVLLPLCLLVMGMIDFGWIFKNYIGVREGVRDTARQVSVGNFGPACPTPLPLTTVTYPASATPAQKAAVNKVLCLAHSDDELNDDAQTRVALVVGASTGASYAAGQPITICEQYKVSSLTGAFRLITSSVHGIVTRATQIVETPNTATPLPAGTSGEATLWSSWSTLCPAPSPVS